MNPLLSLESLDTPFAIIGIAISLVLFLMIVTYEKLSSDDKEYNIAFFGFFFICIFLPWMAKENLIFSVISFTVVGTMFKWLGIISYIHYKDNPKESVEQISRKIYKTILKNRHFNEKKEKGN